jgi:hypothetical protein
MTTIRKTSYSILDLPEPKRSEALARFGMTAEEFAAHMAGIDAEWEEREARIASGEVRPARHPDEFGDAVPVVVEDDQRLDQHLNETGRGT